MAKLELGVNRMYMGLDLGSWLDYGFICNISTPRTHQSLSITTKQFRRRYSAPPMNTSIAVVLLRETHCAKLSTEKYSIKYMLYI